MKKKIAFIVTVPMFIDFYLTNQIKAISKKYSVSVITNISNSSDLNKLKNHVNIIHIDIEREIHFLKDFKALLELIKIISHNKFDLVHSVTPKAGLLAMLSSKLSRTPKKLHMFTGQVWANKSGAIRYLLKLFDWFIASLADIILVDSNSQKNFLLAEGIINNNKSFVLGKGSISGVDMSRFSSNLLIRKSMRENLGIKDNEIVILYLGRLKKDKGILDLVHAFVKLQALNHNLILIIVGPDEEDLTNEIKNILTECLENIRIVDRTFEPEKYMQMSDIFCLPSYREGFGSSIIEAAACGLPSVGSNIYGISDAIVDKETGLLFQKKNIPELQKTLNILINDDKLRLKMGTSAFKRVKKDFSQEKITQELLNLYASLLGDKIQ